VSFFNAQISMHKLLMENKNFMTHYDNYREVNGGVKIIKAADLFRKHQQKERKRWRTYDKILKQCMNEIERSSNNDLYFCFFVVPEILFGIPLFNLKKCIYYISSVLVKNGYSIKFNKPNILYISWFLPNSRLLPPPPTGNIRKKFKKPSIKSGHPHYPVNTNYFNPQQKQDRNTMIKNAINKPIGGFMRDNDSIRELGKNNFILNRNKKIVLNRPKLDFL